MSILKDKGGVFSGESLTKEMQFYQLATMVALSEGNVNSATPTAKDNLDRLTQFLAQFGQHVIRSLRVVADVADPNATYGMGTGFQAQADVYVYQFAVEQASSASVDAIVNALDGLKAPFGGVHFDTKDVVTKNTVITKRDFI